MVFIGDKAGLKVNVTGYAIAVVAIALAVIIAFYVLRSIAIYVMAKRRNIKHAFLAFIPWIWIYIGCKIIAEQKIFGRTFGKLALIICIIFTVSEVLTLLYNFFAYLPLVGYALQGGEVVLSVDKFTLAGYQEYWVKGSNVYVLGGAGGIVYPAYAQSQVFTTVLNVTSYVSMVVDIASIVLTISFYIALFRTYWPRHFVMASILSVLGFFAPFVFAIRKYEQIDYRDYVRSRYASMYNVPPQYPNGANPNQQNSNDEPFREFNDKKPEDPFAEFSDNKAESSDPFKEFDDDVKH